MKRMLRFAALAALACCCWLANLVADDDKKETRGSGDTEFARKASAAGMAEVNLGELAMRFAHSPEVKQFATQMVADHRGANAELTALANRQGISLAKSMDDDHQKLYEKIKALSGEEFDRKYMDAMVKDHEEAVKLFERESKDGKDETMKSWAGKTLPALKHHLEMARSLAKKDKGEKERVQDKKNR